jgi:CP family cyanate transporter-like MFS transporter
VNQRAFLIALLLIAANLRPSLTGVGPLLETLRADLGLSATAAGWLSSLPVLMFGAFAPLARLARQLSAERLMLGGLFALMAGILVRSAGGSAALFIGTVGLAAGVAGINVLIPVLIKQHYPERVPGITTAYATVMGGFAALASGIAVPLAHTLPGGWRSSLASWALLAAIALVFWVPQARSDGSRADASQAAPSLGPPWRSRLAWQITGFMGLQSTFFYIAVSWFPAVLRESGYSPVAGGWLLTLFQGAALFAGLAVPPLVRRFKDQRALAFGVATLSTIGTLGILLAPRAAIVWMILLGCGAGPSLILALSFMGLRAKTQQMAASLSLMSQSIGYLIAACGPILFGVIHDYTGNWTVALLATAGVTVLQALCGIGAGRGTCR